MSQLKLDKDMIRELAALLEETTLTEIEIEEGDHRIRVARNATGAISVSPAQQAPAGGASPSSGMPAAPVIVPGTVTSPMVGTVYYAPEPGAPPFVKVGDQVSEGDTLMIVEAMKIMNAIPAPHGGKIAAMLIDDGQPVEFGEPLLVIE